MICNLKSFLIVTLILLGIFHATCAAESNLETFKVGYIEGTSFVYEDIPKHKTGYGYEYMEFLSNYLHCKFEYVGAENWDDLTNKLQSGEVDIIPDIPGDYRKLTNVLRTDHVVGRYLTELIAKDIKPQMKLGHIPTDHATPSLPKIASDEGFSYELVPFQKFEDMRLAFREGKIDGYVDAMFDPQKSHNVAAVFDRQSYRLLVRADKQDLLHKLNFAMDQLLTYQPNIRDRLTLRYLRAKGVPLTLSRSENEYLAQKRQLKAAIFLNYQPYAYHDETGKLVGVFPELLKVISEDLGVEIEIIETQSVDEVKNLISKGEIDFVADAVCDFSWSEGFNLKQTHPYMMIDYVPVTRRNFVADTQIPVKIACVNGLYNTEHFIELHYSRSQLIYFDTIDEALEAVSEGHADIVFLQRNAAHSIIEETENYSLEAKTASVYSEPRSLGVYAYADPRLWLILNKEIGHIDPGWLRDLVNMNQRTHSQFSLKWAVYHHPLRSFAIVALLLAAIGGFIIYRGRMRQRHFELVEHMAYTDLRYDLRNVRWLEREVPLAMEKLQDDEPNMKTFFIVFSMASSAAATETQGHRLIDKQFKTMAKNIADEPFVIFTGAGIDVDHLICFCKAENIEKIINWVKSVIEVNSYMTTAAESVKIVLHTRAGITPHESKIPVQQSIDRALIACHQSASNDFQIFDEKLQETLSINHDIEGRMEQALIDGEFKAWYQPKYNIKTREIIGAEALVRWISPELGFMPPGKFIPLFERNGFVIQVDYYLLEQTCKLQRERLDAGKEVVPISVNQSRLHMTEEGYLEKIQMIRDTYELPEGLIELEVTETMFGDFDAKAGHDNAEHIINELHKMGFSVSVDDFGSGYSSFMMLGSLPMDVMKIDRSLLTGADKSPRLREILHNVINLGNSLKMRVLCEGIETKEEEDLLLELGCYYGQGFLNAKPMPVEDFVEFLEKRNAEVRAKIN